MLERLGVSGHRRRLVPRAHQELVGLLPLLGARVVVGQDGRELIEPIGEETLDEDRHGTVQMAALLEEHALVGSLLDECVLENVGQFRQARRLADQLDPHDSRCRSTASCASATACTRR